MDDNRRQRALHSLRYYDTNINLQEEEDVDDDEGFVNLFQFKKKKKTQRLPQQFNQRIAEKLRQNEEQKILEAYEKHLEEEQNALKLMDLENQEDLFSSFDNNFYSNKSLFEQIWFQQDHNLKVCLNYIYKKFLQPKGINLSETEKKILLSKLNTLVIGRSGTGKTTSTLLKISAMDMSFKKFQEKDVQPIKNLRICFTTISDYLKQDVHTTFRSITNSNSNVQNYEAHSLSHVKTWPLFTTVRNLINMIDGNLAIPFLKRDTNGRILNDLGYQNNNFIRSKIKGGDEFYQEIGIQQFIHEFWQEHKQQLETLNVDYFTAYSQINSYITGHLKSFLSHDGMISLQQYINIVGRTKNYLDNQQKVNIYKICQMYQKWKISKKYFDLNDQVIYILKQIFQKRYFSNDGFFHYIFIDEVQDLNCLIIYLLTIITEQNIFMGGDTAQTISQEIAFRFTELKAFFQKRFMIEDFPSTLVLQQQLVEEQLLKNFRCHQQITAINNTLIRLLELLFPTSIDILQQEISEKQGPKPLLIHDVNHLKKFLFQDIKLSENDQKGDLDKHFGICDRLQAFLVQNDTEKEKIQKILDQDVQLSIFQVYTIFESKGLEFQDVITYNLLSSSFKATGCWAVLNYISENFEKTQQLEFHIQKVYGKEFPKLIPEIKNLYVAFSRARSRVFIFEDLDGQQKIFKNPISIFFEKHHLIEEKLLTEEQQKLIMECHKSYIVYNEPKINPDQFLQQAQILFEKKQYKYAGDFFKRIGDQSNYHLCQAKLIADDASKLIVQNKQKFESEKQLYLMNRIVCENQIQIYKQVKKMFQDSLYFLEKIEDFKTISQIQYTLGEYELAIEASKNRIQQIKQNKDIQLEEKEIMIREISREIKIFYLNLLLILEEKFKSAQNEIQQQKKKAVYIEFDITLESFPLIDIELVLFVQNNAQDFNKLYNSLVETSFAFDDKELKKNINYYYPSLLNNELSVYQKFYQLQRVIEKQENSQFFSNQHKKFIEPFQDIFQQIIIARMSKKQIENLSIEFEQLINNYSLNISSQQFLMQFIIYGHFNQYEIQLMLSRYFNNQKLQLLSIANFAFQNYKNSGKINNFLDKIITDYQIFQQNSYHSQNLNLKHLTFLGLYDKLIERKIEPYSDRFLFSLNYFKQSKSSFKNIIYQHLINFQIFSKSKFKNFEILKSSYEIIEDCEQNSENMSYKEIYDYVLMQQNLMKIRQNSDKKVQKIPQYQFNFNYGLQQFKQIKEQRYIAKLRIKEIKYKCFQKYEQKNFIDVFLSSVQELMKIIDDKYPRKQIFMRFFEYQKLLFKFYYGMKIISLTTCFIDFETQQIEQITRLASLIINYNNSVCSQKIFGEDNKLFIDALCSIFGYVCPNSSRFENQVESQINIWDDYNVSDFYFVDSKSQFYEQDQQVINLFAFFPIISNYNIQAVYRQKAILLSKKRIAQVLKDFIIGYSQYLIYKIKESYKTKNYEENQTQLNQSIQILYLQNELKVIMKSQFSYIISKQIELIKKQNQLNDEQAEEAFEIYFKKLFQIDSYELTRLKYIIIKNGLFIQFNKNLQSKIHDGEQNQFVTFFVQEFIVISKKMQDLNQKEKEETEQQQEVNINKNNLGLQSNNQQISIQVIQEENQEQKLISQNQGNLIECENELQNIGQELMSDNISEIQQQQNLKDKENLVGQQNLGSQNFGDDDNDNIEVLEEDLQNEDEDEDEDLQDQIIINQKLQEKEQKDLFVECLEGYMYIFSMMHIRQLTHFIPQQMKLNCDLAKAIFQFFNSKQQNQLIYNSKNALEIIHHIKGRDQKITNLLLLTSLSEFIKHITIEDFEYLDILEEQVEYFDIQQQIIIINKNKNSEKLNYFNKMLCQNYLVNVFNCVQIIEIHSFNKFKINNIIVYATLLAFSNYNFSFTYEFLEGFSQFLKQMINYDKKRNKSRFYFYDQIETQFQNYQERLYIFRSRYFNTLIYLLDNKYLRSLQILLKNTKQHHLQSLYFLRSKRYQIKVNYLEKDTQNENNFYQKKREEKQIVTQELKNLNIYSNQNNQLNYNHQKIYQRYDFIGYIHQKLDKETQIQKLCDLICKENTLKDLITKAIKIFQKSRKQILNQISQNEIVSSEQFMLSLEKLEALGNQEKKLVLKLEEFKNFQENLIAQQQLKSQLQEQISKLQQIFDQFKIDKTLKIEFDVLDNLMFIKQQLVNLN
ncbi:hypothetical protein TTHERM_00827180 (macronuclear) [Tetrahymena thermophila SB210]|uniref:UvrD-like helicase ATP-binding domain-containing protein n=1 Tax=Tetrahymena thermophila (strain SB210) TaxID=312017 RepID=Q22EF1_TETTS|nr:hypothetical protein TTHERM_00827180 [Tetrahymena thermophila SB210]EAR83701.2 hypothetical protein TTHERM_00827180 [Tetrahymena thermophila SB210]|eukprot:XP_001031364.2 hypothetical protein TTHERM_00827180 [Tetrahymena thermophila SB210]